MVIMSHEIDWLASEAAIQDVLSGAGAKPELWARPSEFLNCADWEQFQRTYHKLYEETRKSYEQIEILD